MPAAPTRIPRSATTAPSGSWESFWSQALDASLLAAIVVVPLSMGWLYAARHLALAVVAGAASISAAALAVTRRRSAEVPLIAKLVLAGGVLIPALQLAPLSGEWRDTLSPAIANLLPLWTGPSEPGELGTWTTLSLTPTETFRGFTSFVACGLLFLATLHRVRTACDVERVLKWIAAVVVAIGVFGVVQHLAGNGKFYWAFEHPMTDTTDAAKGPFPNRNHFASLMALGLGPLLAWIVAASRRSEGAERSRGAQPGSVSGFDAAPLWIGVGIVVVACVLSLSRGGFLALTTAAVVFAAAMAWTRLVSGRMLAGLLGCAALVGGLLAVAGTERFEARIEGLASLDAGQADASEARRKIWAANIAAFRDFARVGTGVGSHRDVYPTYIEDHHEKEFQHAENSYLQIASETGFGGASLAGLSLVALGWWCVRTICGARSKNLALLQAAVAAGLASSAVHAAFDFVWYMPGLMVFVIVLAACACRLHQLHGAERAGAATGRRASGSPAVVRIAALAGCVALGAWIVGSKVPAFLAEPHWNDYYFLARNPGAADSLETSRQRLAALREAVVRDPECSRIHQRLSLEYVLYFNAVQARSDDAMFLPQLREAATASAFATRGELRGWLEQAVGKHLALLDAAAHHARRAAALSPLPAHTYLHLRELSFVDGGDAAASRACLLQARRTGPRDGLVMVETGNDAWLDGRPEEALEFWKTAFQRNPFCRDRLIDLLAGNVEPQFLLDEFDPDWNAMLVLKQRYERLGLEPDLAAILPRYAELAIREAQRDASPTAARLWLRAAEAYDQLGDAPRQIDCLHEALKVDPSSYDAHFLLGSRHRVDGRLAEAAEEFAWCARRRPRDPRIRKLAEAAYADQLRSPAIQKTSGTRGAPRFE